MSTRPFFLFFAFTLSLAAAQTCSRACPAGKFCISWRGVISECVDLPTPNAACSCIALYRPVCCRISVRRGWLFRFLWKGTFTESDACQCGCRGGAVCSSPLPSIVPTPRPGCTRERVPVCCKVGIEAPRTAANKCVCTTRLDGTVISQGECISAPPLGGVACTTVFDPVCCSIPAKSQPETASNACVCTKQKLGEVEATSECPAGQPPGANPPGGPICRAQFNPVCCSIPGKSQPETASNACVCTKQKVGTVEPPGRCAPSSQPTICTQEYAPVCCLAPGATNPTTASNKCTCGKGRVVLEGEC